MRTSGEESPKKGFIGLQVGGLGLRLYTIGIYEHRWHVGNSRLRDLQNIAHVTAGRGGSRTKLAPKARSFAAPGRRSCPARQAESQI